MTYTRRHALLGTLAAATLCAIAPAHAQNKIKVAAVYTVPVEQQWVSRIDKALKAAVSRGEIEYVFSENVANADYERVMRQYWPSAAVGSVAWIAAASSTSSAVARGGWTPPISWTPSSPSAVSPAAAATATRGQRRPGVRRGSSVTRESAVASASSSRRSASV